LDIKPDNLNSPQVIALIHEHLAAMEPTAPSESRHALDLSGLRGPDISVWALWDDDTLAGIGALKRLSADHVEIKSMKTAQPYLRQGVAARILTHIIHEAKQAGYKQVSLETGSMVFFEPARKLYANFGFGECGPFGGYVDDPNSLFMTKALA
tara:strand:- start:1085 stop:1543 length:459 start_codon:yes stop_codon:yes gene_type:complete